MAKPSTPERPCVEAAGSSLRISWSIAQCDPEITASAIKVRIKGSQKLQNYDHGTGRLVPKGGSTVPAPISDITIDGCEEGLEYEAVIAVMNSEGWSDPSGFSQPGWIGMLKHREKPSRPSAPNLSALGKGKLRVSWVLPPACPPVEATQVQLTDLGTGKTMLVDASNGKLVSSGRTTFAASRLEANVNGVQDCVEYAAAICCRNAEGFGEYSMLSDSVVNIDAKGQVGGMQLVVHEGAPTAVPQLVPLGEGKIKVRWTLPDEAKSTIVKLRRLGNQNWYLVGGAAIPAPASDTVATGLEEGIEYEAIVSFLIGGRWCCESEVSKPVCIGELKLPTVPAAPKEPRLYVMDVSQGILRIRWQYFTSVPPLTGALVKFRAVGSRKWLYAHPTSGALSEPSADKEPDLIPFPQSELDLRGLPLGIRFEACIAFKNKLGTGPFSKESDIVHIGMLAARPLRCTFCGNDFDLMTSEYTKPPETFWCPLCRFRLMDPFNAVLEPHGMLRFHMFMRPSVSFSLDVPDLKQWRKEDQSIWMRCIRMNSDNSAQVWPTKLIFTSNGEEMFRIDPPEEGHVRRDVPRDVAPGLRPGMNNITVTIEDDHVAGFAFSLVRTQAKTAEQISDETHHCEEEDAQRRVCELLKDTWDTNQDDQVLDDVDDDVTCVLSNRLKLRCPLSFERVDIPVRGESCMHLQCFGLGAYLESNMKMRAHNNRWTCPVCSNVLKPHDLRVDKYVQRVLSETPSHVDEVLIQRDGSWTIIEDEQEAAAAGPTALQQGDKATAEKNAGEEGAAPTAMTGDVADLDGAGEEKRKATDDGVEAPLTKRQRRLQQRRELKAAAAKAGTEPVPSS
eukprot:TRINITY_DN90476_c0_g1_i1.p1 TRINITY_DN90476_c0_g1~~TRINITY_DN90476_c0_g1_i1.p1  ORF type:complete len:845 (+),score=127.90 TRINITY_DN90476_c0_g1_i1:61-2595(+)